MFIILASGPSMSQTTADAVRGRGTVMAVSDAYLLAPWSDVLVSSDAAWWRHHHPVFAGRRFSAHGGEGTEVIQGVPGGSNSGVLGILVARHLGAKKILLLGFDGHGSHFFGDHPEPLRNTSAPRRRVHAEQHKAQAREAVRDGIEIVNGTPGTVLTCYPQVSLGEVLC